MTPPGRPSPPASHTWQSPSSPPGKRQQPRSPQVSARSRSSGWSQTRPIRSAQHPGVAGGGQPVRELREQQAVQLVVADPGDVVDGAGVIRAAMSSTYTGCRSQTSSPTWIQFSSTFMSVWVCPCSSHSPMSGRWNWRYFGSNSDHPESTARRRQGPCSGRRGSRCRADGVFRNRDSPRPACDPGAGRT